MSFHKYIIKKDIIPSTNAYAKEILQEEILQNLTIITTTNQTAGKGQTNNSWESTPGENLTFSIIFYPEKIKANEQFVISQKVCIGIINYLKYRNINATIKWPNDIYVDTKKICGILIENILLGSNIKNSIIGIGLNVNQQVFYSNAPNPISMNNITAQKYDIDQELNKVTDFITEKLSEIDFDKSDLTSEYLNNLYRFEKICNYKRKNGSTFAGKIVGIDSIGRLNVQNECNEIETFAFKEIEYLF
ncbi:MAG: biotin--[acetyl-CoA-carboxylase] ligase [Bacteroidales bacterium]|nr:biotin--[acetyl-CoA-carboxylase] ligase [Bacteroidales bacterium]